jgi:MoaA/NifB/PqqE/SkfB family radical SAM enzyme
MSKNSPWCVNPFIQFSQTADGYYRVCCVGEVDRSSKIYHGDNMSPMEYFNSDVMQTIRKDMLTKDFSEVTKNACAQCIKNKENKIHSKRDYDNTKQANSKKVESAVNKTLENYTSYLDESHLDSINIKVLGNLCNLKCIMCGPEASSKILAERIKKFPRDWEHYKGPTVLQPYNSKTKDRYFNELAKISNSLNKFILVGGESMIHPDFEEFFEMIADQKNAGNLELQIITNGTVLPDFVLEKAHKFRMLHLCMSIDGIKEKGEYIRSDLDWETFNKNVRKANNNSNIYCSFTVAVQMLNIGYLDEIHEYMLDNNLSTNNINWNNLVTQPATMRAINLPAHIKEQYLQKLKKSKLFKLGKIPHIIKLLNTTADSHEEFLRGMLWLKKLDIRRNKCLIDIFPEFEEYYSKITVGPPPGP